MACTRVNPPPPNTAQTTAVSQQTLPYLPYVRFVQQLTVDFFLAY
jgi:hypothetical protein